ncbi:uncharacterized protein SETTUDRAFT_92623 [Exserohilum turcica Et28A]|uniref:Uncharacterized protein n=1 Tax=Exserohilum turcicum (strain 28A) TaxID=671987 RepID=R0K2N4_EXST2|nr:uncharacterized protein SETTUDRAFT_92623 [Exserohilum turcica Et28A]EOA83884.1 hypothetical protein SETTUDRAFT_92623 [Exserohilum turcica Et28A]
MAPDKPASLFVSLPLEVRHTIFEHAAARESAPKELLRFWFEKNEVEQLIAKHISENPDGPAPRAVYGDNEHEEERDSAEEVEGGEDDGEGEEDDEEEEEQGLEEEQDNGIEDDAGQVEHDNEGEVVESHGASARTAQLRPPTPTVRPHKKWRFIPKFMRLTHHPPPVELLLTCQQLYIEAKNWFYDAAVLRIYPTASFAHTSFFEEALGQISDAAFSPIHNIRRVEAVFVWDSTWIRAEETGVVGAVFPALLQQRASFLYKILSQAPDLHELVIHWHDSAQDHESANLMTDTLGPFYTLPATVKVKEHYIAADSRPSKRSIAGRRRVEFQNIVDMGLDRLF